MKSIKVLAAAGAIALVPTVASAFSGNLIECVPTAGQKVVVSLSPGLQCDTITNKIKIKGAVSDNCVIGAGTLAAPDSLAFCVAALDPVPCCTGVGTGPTCTLWDAWAGGKLGSKILGTDVTTVDFVSVDLKSTVFGSCNFGGNPDSIGAGGAGKFALYNSQLEKVAGGKGQFFGTVGGDIATQSAATAGLVTKGFGAGANLKISIGIDFGGASDCNDDETENDGSCNGNILACNVDYASTCPVPGIPPSFALDLISDANSVFRIDIQDDADCVANNDPFPCCTGAGAGNC